MVKKGGVYIVISILTVGLILVLQYNKPKKVNWFPSYVAQHKIPYGTFVVNELVQKTFKDRLQQVYKPPFEFLRQNESASGTYLIVNDRVDFGETELEVLLNWTSKGNTLFVASSGFETKLLDTLNLNQTSLYSSAEVTPMFYHQLVNTQIKRPPTPFTKEYYSLIFSTIDTLNTVVLGEVHTTADNPDEIERKVNVIKHPFGKGSIILSTFPQAFTNYFILKDENREYTAGLLSYLNAEGALYMDNHHKSGKSFYTSPMYIFLNTKEFKWAYYMVLIGSLIYVIFEGKRKQRPIAVIKPLKNQTLAFTKTIADMYYETGQREEIAKHQIANFLDYIRNRFYLNTESLDDQFHKNLAARSNHTIDDIRALFQLIGQVQKQPKLSDDQLGSLNKKIENFKIKVDGK